MSETQAFKHVQTLEMHHLEYEGGGSHKFYRTFTQGRNEIRQWGRVGAKGRMAHFNRGTPAAAVASAKAIMDEKVAKGYRWVVHAQVSVSSIHPYGSEEWEVDLDTAARRVVGTIPTVAGSAPVPAQPAAYTPMLCGRGEDNQEHHVSRLTEHGAWSFDVKWDGIRCITEVTPEGLVTLTSRSGKDITGRFPEIVAEMAKLPPGRWVFDGELVAFDETGAPKFTLVNRRLSLSAHRSAKVGQREPATYVVFDLLAFPGGDLRRQTFFDRVSMLDMVTAVPFEDSEQVIRSPRTDDGNALWNQTREMGLEGIVAKAVTGVYVAGDRRLWIKFRHEVSVTCIVTGFEEGKGSNTGALGALTLGMLGHDGTVVEVGKVGTGFDDAARKFLWANRSQLYDEIVEVQCAPPRTDQALRFPVFKGIRGDASREDCTTDQLA